ncbi:MAG: mitochondrial fission ELM1 family protein [Candidatus Omnitrophica bacterium]|nr:mitochondrial fission ELM1 family protein [Candidatus Omnitrophota bacterium]
MEEYLLLSSIKVLAKIVCLLPLRLVLWIGKGLGLVAYYLAPKPRSLVYSSLKMAFADSKSPQEIKQITKRVFQNYSQNVLDLMRMPCLTPEKFQALVLFEGKENIQEALAKGNGVILLAMHFGSWEMASISCAMLGYPYKVMVRAQEKYSKIDDLLNSYRSCGGSIVLSRGMGTRDLIKSLKNNEVVGMVVDQGGKDGTVVPFFGRGASLSDGAVRLALKLDVPLCFSIIVREQGSRHRIIINKAMELERTGDIEADIKANLIKISKLMENYVRLYPAEYMWFYKTWKYSDQSNIVILDDGRTGHLRQSETVAKMIEKALAERKITTTVEVLPVSFKTKTHQAAFSLMSFLPFLSWGQSRLGFLRHFLTPESYTALTKVKADFVVSCGSMTSGVNYMFSLDTRAKSLVILRPGAWGYKRFDRVILPQHDYVPAHQKYSNIIKTNAAPNLIDAQYLSEQKELLLKRYSHLRDHGRFKIGLLVGGDAKNLYLSEQQMRILVHQIQNICTDMKVEVIVSTSRRTPSSIEQILIRELQKKDYCPLLVVANQKNIPEAVGGILGLCDLIIVSGDSISMVSEAASSGKNTIVFEAQAKTGVSQKTNKHNLFIHKLHQEGFVICSDVKNMGETIFNVIKGKMKTRKINDQDIIFESAKRVI